MTDFDGWARLSARLLRRNALDGARLIREAGVEHEWHRADAHWYGQLLDDVEAGRTDRIERYRLLCAEVMAARRRAGDPVESPLDALPPDETTASAGRVPAFARDFTSRAASRPAPGQRGTALNLDDALDAATKRALAAGWSVEDYAWLCAELERFPERADAVWRARGIVDDGTQQAVRHVWSGRLEAEGQLRVRYEELLSAYRELLRQR